MTFPQFTQWITTSATLWIGLTDRQTEGIFAWESGRLLSADVAVHWKSDSPTDLSTQNCVYIAGWNGDLDDTNCSGQKRFVCQIR